MIRSKKGDFDVVQAMILTLIVGVLLFAIGYQMKVKMSKVNEEEKCKLSIFANTMSGKVQKGPLTLGKVAYQCPRKLLVIKLDDVAKYGKIDDDSIKRIIAEDLKSCWSMVGGGKMDPFRETTTVNAMFCLVCSDIIFDASFKEQAKKENYELRGFSYWSATHTLPSIKMSLYEYIEGKRPDPDAIEKLKQASLADNSKWDFDQKFVSLWLVGKYEQGWWNKYGPALTMGVSGAVGASFLPDNNVIFQTSYVTEEESLSYKKDDFEMCTIMVN
jgi:hypothetical protein